MKIATDGPTLKLDGDFDGRSTWQVRSMLYDLLDTYDGSGIDVVVDLTEVDNLDLTALKMLAVATHRAHQRGLRLTLRGARPAVRRVLLLSGLHRRVEMERVPTAV